MKYLVFVLFFINTACAAGKARTEFDPQTVASVDLSKYSGLWYEVAHSPNFFQRNCVRSTAEYAVESEGKVSVYNTCYKEHGKTSDISGVASVVDSKEPAKLIVQFDTFFSPKGDYWVVALDDEYEWAVVSGPKNKFIFILSRYAGISESQKNVILDVMRAKGIPTDDLIYDRY